MIDREIRPGRICIIINSDVSVNIGKVVTVLRAYSAFEFIPEDEPGTWCEENGWLCEAMDSDLISLTMYTDGSRFVGPVKVAVCKESQLMPIDDFQEYTVKHKEEEFSE